jgi:hypothetical protein
MNRVLACSVCVAGLLILLQCRAFFVISDWIVVDSYAAVRFPQAHPVLGFFVELAWNIDGLGGRYVLVALAILLVLGLWWSLRKTQGRASNP